MDERIIKSKAKKTELLIALKYPEVPLHNNGSELGARVIARKRDVSLHTKSDEGTESQDSILTIVQTAEKLDVNAHKYCKEFVQKAKKSVKGYYEEFVKYHGDDLAIYPDGLSMTAGLQKQYRLLYESRPKNFVSKVMKEHKLENPRAKISFPPEIMESENGIGIYFNPDEGQEIMIEFNDVINGLKKKGLDLDEDEIESIRGLLFADAISPKFVKKLENMGMNLS